MAAAGIASTLAVARIPRVQGLEEGVEPKLWLWEDEADSSLAGCCCHVPAWMRWPCWGLISASLPQLGPAEVG